MDDKINIYTAFKMCRSETKMRPSDLEICDTAQTFKGFDKLCSTISRTNHFGTRIDGFLGLRTPFYTAIDLDRLIEVYGIVAGEETDFDPQPPSDYEINDMVLLFIAFQNMCIKNYRSNHFGDEIQLFLGTRTPWYGVAHLVKLKSIYLTKKYMIKNQSPKKIKF